MQVQISRNFACNLDEIAGFLRKADAEEAFEALLDDLFEQVIPTLERQPDIGHQFLRRQATTEESVALTVQLQQRLGAEGCLRELIRGNYILLYARQPNALFLLAIKHHRQLSFDFFGRWNV